MAKGPLTYVNNKTTLSFDRLTFEQNSLACKEKSNTWLLSDPTCPSSSYASKNKAQAKTAQEDGTILDDLMESGDEDEFDGDSEDDDAAEWEWEAE